MIAAAELLSRHPVPMKEGPVALLAALFTAHLCCRALCWQLWAAGVKGLSGLLSFPTISLPSSSPAPQQQERSSPSSPKHLPKADRVGLSTGAHHQHCSGDAELLGLWYLELFKEAGAWGNCSGAILTEVTSASPSGSQSQLVYARS